MPEAPEYGNLVYEDRTVAFIDVLGWRNAVSGASARPADDLGWAIHLMRLVASQAEGHRKFHSNMPVPMPELALAVEVSQFSDSIVISVPSGEGQYLLEGYLGQLTALACQNRLLLRGGIARGPIYHRGGMVYGPALVDAFDLEQAASTPRIVLHKDLEDEFLRGTSLRDDNGTYGHRKAWRRDHDNSVFFDFMQPFGALQIFEGRGHPDWKPSIQQFAQYKLLIINGILNNQGNVGVIQKYMWAFRYFIDVMAEYPDVKIPPVVVHMGEDLLAFEPDHWPRAMVTKSVGGQEAPSERW